MLSVDPSSEKWNWASAIRAITVITFLGLAIFAVDRYAAPSFKVDPNNPPKKTNARIVTDPDGRRVAEIRWQPGMAGPIGVLRVPLGYILKDFGLVTGGPNDPNVVLPYTQSFILEALLPHFEPRTPGNEVSFRQGLQATP